MRITKFGHCCLLIEEGRLRILTDPGSYVEIPDVTDIDVILITHEHQDHVHLPSLKVILKNNLAVRIMTHKSVGKLLEEEKIPYRRMVNGEEVVVKNIPISSHGTQHAVIHPDLPTIENTGFLIANRLFYPGDNFYDPHVPIEILALPVSAPWMKISEAIEYAKVLKPKVVFPVHDGMLRQGQQLGPTRRVPVAILEPLGITYVDMIEGAVKDF